jgi:hypothetical protein
MGVGGHCHALAALPSRKQTWCPLYRRLDVPQGWPEQVQNISAPTGFNLRIVQPTVSHYTNYTILAHGLYSNPGKLLSKFEFPCVFWFP